MSDKMAIIGDGDSVIAFKAVGVDAFGVTNREEVGELIKKLAKEYRIIFITDALAKQNESIIDKYLSMPYPIIIPVPSKDGSNGYGFEQMKKAMDKALGVDILFTK